MVSNHSIPLAKMAGIVAVLFAMLGTNANAGGIPVIDAVNVQQTTVAAIENVSQTLKQIQQYQTQPQQYENMIRNTLAPPAYVWAQAQYTMNKLMHMTDTIRYYGQRYGGLDGYLQRFRNVNYYRSSPCFNLDGNCTESAWGILKQGQDASTDAQKSATMQYCAASIIIRNRFHWMPRNCKSCNNAPKPLKDKWKRCNMPTSCRSSGKPVIANPAFTHRATQCHQCQTRPKSIRKPCGRLRGKRQQNG